MAAVQTIESFSVSCTSSGFGISVNQMYVAELIGIYLKYATAAVEQLTRNAVQCPVGEAERYSDPFHSSLLDETKQLLMSIVEHAVTLRRCVEQGTPLQVSLAHKHLLALF